MADLRPELRLSCLPVSYFPEIINGTMSISDWIEEAASYGLTMVDLSFHFFPQQERNARIKNTLHALEKNSINIAIFNTYSNLLHPEKKEREKEIANLLDGIDTAASVGSKWVRLVAGQAYPDTKKTEGIQWVLEGFNAAREKAEKLKIGLVFENHSKPGNWDFPDFAFDPEVFTNIVEATTRGTEEGKDIKILFDTANAIAAGVHPLSLLKKIFRRTACIHAADTKKWGIFQPCPIGQGAVPFAEIFRYLIEKEFSGIISIEEASFNGPQGVQKAVQFIQNTWQICFDE